MHGRILVPHARDWAAECTNFPNEVCEAALAHVIGNKTEAAYRRGDLFDKRRKLMEAWADYCATPKTGKARCVSAQPQTSVRLSATLTKSTLEPSVVAGDSISRYA